MRCDLIIMYFLAALAVAAITAEFLRKKQW